MASDVAWQTRVVPFIKNSLNKAEIGGQRIGSSQFLPDSRWVSRRRSPTCSTRRSPAPAVVAAASRPAPACTAPASTPPPTATRRCSPAPRTGSSSSPNQPFAVKFTNQGENDEFDIKVTVRMSADTEPDHALQDRPEARAAGERDGRAAARQDAAARRGRDDQGVVAKVPGETKTDNNRSEYPALFERG